MRPDSRTWVATFDGAEARVYGYDRKGRLHELPGEAKTGGHGDAEGRGPTVEQASFVESPGDDPAPGDLTEDQFVRKFAERLTELARKGEFERLIVAAGPRALGVFRKAVDPALQAKVAIELAKDYVHTPIKELEQAVAKQIGADDERVPERP